MTRYVVSRLGQLVLVLVGVSIVVFLTMHVLPYDVATLLLGDRATAAQLGLDRAVWVQYFDFAAQAIRGDFGTSPRSSHAAIADVLNAFPVTRQLSLSARSFSPPWPACRWAYWSGCGREPCWTMR